MTGAGTYGMAATASTSAAKTARSISASEENRGACGVQRMRLLSRVWI